MLSHLKIWSTPVYTLLYTIHKHMDGGRKLNKQTLELSVCAVPVMAFSVVQIS